MKLAKFTLPQIVPLFWGLLALYSFWNGMNIEGIGYMILMEITGLSNRMRKIV